MKMIEGLNNLPGSITHRETKVFILSKRRLYIKMATRQDYTEKETTFLISKWNFSVLLLIVEQKAVL